MGDYSVPVCVCVHSLGHYRLCKLSDRAAVRIIIYRMGQLN